MRGFLNFLINLIYPKYCVACKKLGDYLCENCFEAVEYLIFPPKIKIDKIARGKKPAFDAVYSLVYLSPPVSQLVKAMKYKHVKGIAEYLGKWLYLMLAIKKTDLENIDFVTAVPMHKKRKIWRGFNHAEIMAKTLAKFYGKKYLPFLIKKAQTKNQASVKNKQKRATNLKNVFEFKEKYLGLVKNTKSPEGKTVMLVDDVLTTGATLNECAKSLKRGGIKKVVAISFARQD